MKKIILFLITYFLASCIYSQPNSKGPEFVPDELIVWLQPNVDAYKMLLSGISQLQFLTLTDH
jgi:hypothetical protein